MKSLLKMALVAAVAGVGFVASADEFIYNLSKEAALSKAKVGAKRTSDKYSLVTVPKELTGKPMVTVKRGAGNKPGAGFSFKIKKPATVYLLVHNRGKKSIPKGWVKTKLKSIWKAGGSKLGDTVYKKDFKPGVVEIPPHTGMANKSSHGIPNAAVIVAK